MMTEDDLIRLLEGLTRDTLHRWIDYGWVQPARQGEAYVFAEIDCARVRLIRDVHDTMEVNDEVMPLILSLMDQVYGPRVTLISLADEPLWQTFQSLAGELPSPGAPAPAR